MFFFKKKTPIKLCILQCAYQNTICIFLDILHNLYTYTIRIYYCYNI